jgi:hypothetical protein
MPERPATPARWLHASHPMDEGRTRAGLTDIAAWRRETTEKYRHTVEPLAVAERVEKSSSRPKSPGISRQPGYARLRLPARERQDLIVGDSVAKQNKKRDGICSRRVQHLFLAGPGAESALWQSVKSLAGDPSEVTALGVRHWITSFRC